MPRKRKDRSSTPEYLDRYDNVEWVDYEKKDKDQESNEKR